MYSHATSIKRTKQALTKTEHQRMKLDNIFCNGRETT